MKVTIPETTVEIRKCPWLDNYLTFVTIEGHSYLGEYDEISEAKKAVRDIVVTYLSNKGQSTNSVLSQTDFLERKSNDGTASHAGN